MCLWLEVSSSVVVNHTCTHYLIPVYALYQKSTWVGLAFLALILGEVSAVIIGVVKHIPGNDFKASSLLLTSLSSYTYFG